MRSLWLATSRGSDRGGVGQKAGGRTPGLDNLPIQPAASSHAQTTFSSLGHLPCTNLTLFRPNKAPRDPKPCTHQRLCTTSRWASSLCPSVGGRVHPAAHCADDNGFACLANNFDVERLSAIAMQSSRKLERG